jgi:very-short-patch-repair endonuclease
MKTVGEAARDYRAEVERRLKRPDQAASSGFAVAFGRCESPIEQAFCLEIFQVSGVKAIEGEFGPALLATAVSAPVILVFGQQPILRFRADFLLVGLSPQSAEPRFVIVECDGEAYHTEREQTRRDAARQAALVATGFHVIRFTGAEIFRDPERVVKRTLLEFAGHGWKAATAAKWVSNANLLRALAELRAAAEVRT